MNACLYKYGCALTLARQDAVSCRGENEGGRIHACAGCAWEIQLRPLARRVIDIITRRTPMRRRPLVRVRVIVVVVLSPFLPHLFRIYCIYKTHPLYVYITPPTLPTFLFIGFVGKIPFSPASSFTSSSLCTSALLPPPPLSCPHPSLLPSKPPTSLEHRCRRASSCLIFPPLVSFIPLFFSTTPFPFSTSHFAPLSEHPRGYIFLQGS